jgi:acetate kinase
MMKILVVNCGSSSIKYRLFDMPGKLVLATGMVERIGEQEAALIQESENQEHRTQQPIPDHEEGMRMILQALTQGPGSVIDNLSEIGAVGHRVVHGGETFSESVVLDEQVIASIESVADLAPLHNPPNLVGIRAAQQALPAIGHVAVFDTAFHATIPPTAYTYALPYELYEKYGVRRYGFHGTSHDYVARRAVELAGCESLGCITIHLGNGCSMAAVKNGKCIDTSMGLTPLEGLVMGTRSGDFDPAILFYLTEHGYDLASLNNLCNKQSGLLGVSGQSNDMRTLTQLAEQGDARAQLAIDIFCYRIKKYLGAYTAALGTLDRVIFTGGIGENAPAIRAGCCSDLQQLGIALDSETNRTTVGGEAAIQAAKSRVQVWVIRTDEEGVIAGDTFALIKTEYGEVPR